nr:integration host factor, actinobacterial type [Kitasatospora sp. MBT63]
MSLPVLTTEQRHAALAKAMLARAERAALLVSMKSGEVGLAAVFERDDEITKRLQVVRLLRALPGVGVAKAQAVMEEIGIAASRRVRGLGPNQRSALLERFGAAVAAAPPIVVDDRADDDRRDEGPGANAGHRSE